MSEVLILNQSETEPIPALLNGVIHLFTLSLNASVKQIEDLSLILSPEERKKAGYYKFDPVRHSYIVSQAVLRMLLAAYVDTVPENIKMGAHKKGKPYLINDDSLFFNVSHSHQICVYAFSRDAEVGIDIEQIRDLPDIDQLIERNLTPLEKKEIQKFPENRLKRFIEFWTYKESYLKAIGEGLRLSPENLEFSLENGTIKLQAKKYEFDTIDWKFKGFTRKENYTGTLAYTGKDTNVREMSITLGN